MLIRERRKGLSLTVTVDISHQLVANNTNEEDLKMVYLKKSEQNFYYKYKL